MIRIFTVFISITLVIFFSSCQKQRQAVWMYYWETQCADKWKYTNNNEVLKENVIEYFKSRNVIIYDMEIFRVSDPESCLACHCKTGRKYKLKVKKSDVNVAKTEGLFE